MKPIGLFLLLWLSLTQGALAAQVVVNDPSVAGEISQSELRAIYSMKRQFWPDGTAITVVTLAANDPLHVEFCKNQLKLLPFQLNREWDRLVFSGMGERPQQVASAEELLELVSRTKGAIGYLPDQMEAAGHQLNVKF
ncbi:hypothetical protein [uncultured Ferrimonas sp.]|uniref:hypothetical protein n=1 Tax=uncultured Ferrimonas sp. TaxID=432640 RepID=UPI002608B2C7|nr:hypothetical protein [uncultured Ferrimonas sp.]